MLLAVPLTMLIAPSISTAFKSGILISAISRTLSIETLPTLFLFGSLLPLSIPAAFFNKAVAGEVLVIKLKDLSSYTDYST